ncbi:MAG: ATPase domain-containing protein [Candidatus Bathyarchaeia archaeon]
MDDRIPTGIPGLDEMLDGGFPSGRVVLILGEPGTGKTILSAQFIADGILRFNESGVFISMDEAKHHFYKEMSKFGWNFYEFEKQKKFIFLHAAPVRHLPEEVSIGKLSIGRKDFSILSLIESMNTYVEVIDAKRIIVDPISALLFQYPDVNERRSAVLDLIEAIMKTGTTCLLTFELRSSGPSRTIEIEEYLAHGAIILQTIQTGITLARAIRIEKMREVKIDTQLRPYEITDEGIVVYHNESII